MIDLYTVYHGSINTILSSMGGAAHKRTDPLPSSEADRWSEDKG
jgi:hypothetical protein